MQQKTVNRAGFKRQFRSVLSFVLTLAMLVALMPAMTIPAYAEAEPIDSVRITITGPALKGASALGKAVDEVIATAPGVTAYTFSAIEWTTDGGVEDEFFKGGQTYTAKVTVGAVGEAGALQQVLPGSCLYAAIWRIAHSLFECPAHR